MLTPVFGGIFHRQIDKKGLELIFWPPNNNRGMTYQTDGNNLSKTNGYLVGAVNKECYCLNTRLLLRVINQ